MKCKVGIFIGGSANFRGASPAGGAQAFNVLDRRLFEPHLFWADPSGQYFRLPADILEHSSLQTLWHPADASETARAKAETILAGHGSPVVADDLGRLIDLAILTFPDPGLFQQLDYQGNP